MRAQFLSLLSLLALLPCSLQAARLELRQAGTDITETSVLVGREIGVELWIDSEGRSLSGAAIFLSFDDTVFELECPIASTALVSTQLIEVDVPRAYQLARTVFEQQAIGPPTRHTEPLDNIYIGFILAASMIPILTLLMGTFVVALTALF